MSQEIEVFNKKYDDESLYDLGRDISECIDPTFNPKIRDIPVDEHGFREGTFQVSVTWKSELSTEEQLLRELVKALDGAFISSWQSTHAWQVQLDEAKKFLELKDIQAN